MFSKDCTINLIHTFFFLFVPHFSSLLHWPSGACWTLASFRINFQASLSHGIILQPLIPTFNFFLLPITILLLFFSLFGLCWNIHLVYLSLRFLNIWFILWGGVVSLMPNSQPGKPGYSI